MLPWMKRHQAMIREADLPDVVERHNLAELAAAFLVDNGYARIGIDHSRGPTTRWRSRRERAGCAVTSKATRSIERTRSSGLAPPPSGGCRKAMSRTRQLSPTIRGGSPAAGSP